MNTRHLIVGLLGVNAVTIAAFAWQWPAIAAAPPDVVRARVFELVDENGRVRAQLNIEANGEAVFRLRDAAGQIRVKLGANGDGSGLVLLDGSTEPGIHLLAGAKGPSVTLTAKDKPPRTITP